MSRGIKNIRKRYQLPRMNYELNQVLDYPLTVVEAPMGYGKTSAMKDWLGKMEYDFLWQKVFDTDVWILWDELTRGVVSERSEEAGKVLADEFPGSKADALKMLYRLERLDINEPVIIVFDDFHLVDSDVAKFIMETLCELEIEHLHFVLLVRYVTLDRFDELKLKGLVHHVEKDVLAFNPMDIVKYYKICGINLGKKEANELFMVTEGWISALYLLMVEYVNSGKFTNAASINKLVETIIYEPLDDEMKRFLVMLSLVDDFSVRQCEFLWEKGNASTLLDRLVAMISLVTYDESSGKYSFHHVLKKFLNKEAMKWSEKERNLVYFRVAQWYLGEKLFYFARKYFYLGGSYEGVLKTLEVDTSKNFSYDNMLNIKKYLEGCPEKIKSKYYYAMLVFGIHLFVHHEIDLFLKVCDDVSQELEKDEFIDGRAKEKLLGEVQVLLSLTEVNDVDGMADRHRKAWDYLKEPTSLFTPGYNWTFGSPSVMAIYYRESGKLLDVVGKVKDTLPLYNRLTRGHGTGGDVLFEAEYYFTVGEFDKALIWAHKAELKAVAVREDTRIGAWWLMARIYLMTGDVSKSSEMIRRIMEAVDEDGYKHHVHIGEMALGFYYAFLGDNEKVSSKLKKQELMDVQIMFLARPFYNVVYGRMLLNDGEFQRIVGCEDYFLYEDGSIKSLYGRLYALIYLAVGYRRCFNDKKARELMNEAIDIGFRDHVLMPFVENYDYAGGLLEECVAMRGAGGFSDSRCSSGSNGEILGEIKKLWVKYEGIKKEYWSDSYDKERVSLTVRELEVAEMAAGGFTNGEIGERLGVSENTIKKALKSVYSKLGVHSRTLLAEKL